MVRQQVTPSQKSVQETFLDTSRFAIFSAQIAGYLPLSITNGQSALVKNSGKMLLKHSWISIPTFSSVVGLIVIIGWTAIYYGHFKSKIRFVKIFGPTETFAYALIVIVGSFMGILLRIRAFCGGVPEFFQDNLKLLQSFENSGFPVCKLKEIIKIKTYMKWSFLAYLIPLVVHCLLVHGIRPVLAYKQYKVWLPDIVYSIGSGFWVFWSYLLISNLWIILFPRIYSACYQEVSKAIVDRFSKKRYDYSKSYYLSEICKSRPNNKTDHSPFLRTIYQNQIDIEDPEDVELKVGQYLDLIVQLGKMIDKYNQIFGERLLCEMITSIAFIVLYAFFGCFWANRGEIRIIGEVVTPLYVNGKKLIELGYSSGNISREAQIAMKTLIDNVPIKKLSLGLTRKIRLLQIQIDSHPPTVSAKQFFTISRGSVTTVLSGMAGFLVALVQFRESDGDAS